MATTGSTAAATAMSGGTWDKVAIPGSAAERPLMSGPDIRMCVLAMSPNRHNKADFGFSFRIVEGRNHLGIIAPG
jgi:hypothetical protein